MGGEHRVPVVAGHLDHVTVSGNPGVIDEDPHLAELIAHLIERVRTADSSLTSAPTPTAGLSVPSSPAAIRLTPSPWMSNSARR